MKGFIPYIYKNGTLDGWEHLEAAPAAYHIGEVLKFSGGKLAVATQDDQGEYISMAETTIEAGGVLPCIAVSPDTEYEVTLTAPVSGLVPGFTCGLASGAMSLAVSPSGKVKCIRTTGQATGDVAIVKLK